MPLLQRPTDSRWYDCMIASVVWFASALLSNCHQCCSEICQVLTKRRRHSRLRETFKTCRRRRSDAAAARASAAAVVQWRLDGRRDGLVTLNTANSRPSLSTARTRTCSSLKPWLQLRFDYDTTTTRLRRKIDMFIFCSRRIASNGSRRARHLVVGSQWYRKPISQLRFDYDTNTIRRYHDAFDYDGSDQNYDSTAIQLRRIARACSRSTRFDARKNVSMSIFRRSRVVVVSQSNRNCDIGFVQAGKTNTTNLSHQPLYWTLSYFWTWKAGPKTPLSLFFFFSVVSVL